MSSVPDLSDSDAGQASASSPDTSGLDVSPFFDDVSNEKTEQIPPSSVNPMATAPMQAVPDAATRVMPSAPRPSDRVEFNTAQMPAVSGNQVQYRQASDPHAGQSPNRTVVIVAVVIAVLALFVAIGAGLAFCVAQQDDTASTNESVTSDQQTAQSTISSTDGSSTNESAESKDQGTTVSAEDQAIYNELNTYYDRLGSYDEEIAAVATTFNNTYLKSSMSERSSAAHEAYDLEDAVNEAYSKVKTLNISSSSDYYATYLDIQTCYYDCVMRIEVISEAWSRSLQYSDPSEHEDYICEPLARDRENNTNKYLTDFDSRYPSCKPSAPSA